MPPLPAAPADLTGLLQAWGRGDESALHAPIPLVERELNRIARRCQAGERHARRVSATALVNEAFRVSWASAGWPGRTAHTSLPCRCV
jgi:hypothetical protein